MPDQFTDQLSPYLDGELDPLKARRLEAHLAECAECSAALADLRSIVAAASHYTGRAPASDLWPAIESRLDEPEVVSMAAPRAARPDRRAPGRFSWPELIAASLLMTFLGAGTVWVALRGAGEPREGGLPVAATDAPTRTHTVAFAESQYEAAVADLTRILEEGRASLDSATVRVIDESLRKIDAAIEEARIAIQRDPNSGYLNRQIDLNLRRKLAILRQAADAIART